MHEEKLVHEDENCRIWVSYDKHGQTFVRVVARTIVHTEVGIEVAAKDGSSVTLWAAPPED